MSFKIFENGDTVCPRRLVNLLYSNFTVKIIDMTSSKLSDIFAWQIFNGIDSLCCLLCLSETIFAVSLG